MTVREIRAWFDAQPELVPWSVGAIPGALRLFSHGRIEAFCAPLEAENATARVAIVGLTPGWQQTHMAFIEYAAARRDGASEQTHGIAR